MNSEWPPTFYGRELCTNLSYIKKDTISKWELPTGSVLQLAGYAYPVPKRYSEHNTGLKAKMYVQHSTGLGLLRLTVMWIMFLDVQ